MMRDDAAVSNVIGTIMVLGLAVITLVTVQNTYVPVWEQSEESAQMDTVFSHFAALKADTDRQLFNQTGNAISTPMDLGKQDSGRFLKTSGTTGTLEFKPELRYLNVSAPAINLVRQDGRKLGLLSEDWQTSGGNTTESNIGEIQSLRIRMTAAPGEKLDFKEESVVKISITDKDGDFAGSYQAYVPKKDKHDIWALVTTGTGVVLFDQEIMPDTKFKETSTVWLNVLDPSLPMSQVLDAVEAPFSFALTYDFPNLDPAKWPSVEYAVSYTEVSEDGDVLFKGGAGTQTISNFARSYSGGRLVFEANNQRLPQQTYVFEHGAVILAQPQGSTIVIEPHVFAKNIGSVTLLDMALPSLTGQPETISRGGTTTVEVRGGRATTFVGTAVEFTTIIDTEYPDAWQAFFDDAMRRAGLRAPAEYQVTVNGNEVELTVIGLSADANAHDLQVSMRRAPVSISLGR